MPMEKFLEQGLDATATHGICPSCLAKHAESLGRAKGVAQIAAKDLPAT